MRGKLLESNRDKVETRFRYITEMNMDLDLVLDLNPVNFTILMDLDFINSA